LNHEACQWGETIRRVAGHVIECSMWASGTLATIPESLYCIDEGQCLRTQNDRSALVTLWRVWGSRRAGGNVIASDSPGIGQVESCQVEANVEELRQMSKRRVDES
jgi:hypothetical protein